jgi:ribonuclease HII
MVRRPEPLPVHDALVGTTFRTECSAPGYGAAVSPGAPYPTLRLERRFWEAGDRVVCGIDEVGRGAWAGPATVAAVVSAPEHLKGVRDSKQLTRPERQKAAGRVRNWALAIGIGHASHEECDTLGMTAALRAAGRRALAQVEAQGFVPDRIVLDGNHDYLGLGSRVTTLIKADTSCLAVAAASVVAKVTRDGMMGEEAEHFPAYEFDSNVGYPAPVHKMALAAYGPSAIHRRTWIFMEHLCWRGLEPPPGRLF